MATRIKTVEYPFGTFNTSLAANTRRDWTAINIDLPEGSKVFRSVRLVVGVRDNSATAASMTVPVIGVKIGAAAFSNTTCGNPVANTGEHAHYIFENDVTDYFTTNFTGTTQSVQVGCQFTTPATINHTAKLIITYEYDDTTATHIKTVRIPIESTVGALTATLANIGTTQVPALDTFLPETSKVYRRIWLEAIYNEYSVGTANDANLGISIGGAAEQTTGIHESALASSLQGWAIFDQGATPTWSTASAQNLQARASTITTASTFNHVAFMLCVTYEFAASSTSVINSLMLFADSADFLSGTAATDEVTVEIPLWIEEPGTITQVQSGALVYYSCADATALSIGIGGQTQRTYTDVALLFCGYSALMQRSDSGGAQGSAFTLARGLNRLRINMRCASVSVNTPGGVNPCLILNYTSGRSTLGPGAHNQSLCFNLSSSTVADVNNRTIASAQYMWVPEADYFINQIAAQTLARITTNMAFELSPEGAAGEIGEGGYVGGIKRFMVIEGELGTYVAHGPLSHLFDRWAGEPETLRMSITAARRWLSKCSATISQNYRLWMTKHGITFAVTGTISSSAGGTVQIGLVSPTKGKVKTTSRTGNGSYTINWYDNTETIFTEARESGTLIGRSDSAVAPGSP